MSYSSLYKVFKTKSTRIKEYRNSWHSAPILWSYLTDKYVSPDRNWLLNIKDRALWDLVKREDIPRFLKISHFFTFDYCFLHPNHKEEACDAFKKTYDILREYNPEVVSHWSIIADDLLIDKCKDKRLYGYGLGCTSVSDEFSIKHNIEKCYSLIDILNKIEKPILIPI